MNSPRPFLKWPGGKRQLMGNILPFVPSQIETYYEPFLGGGAVFFELARQKRFKRAVLSDRNPELIKVYAGVKKDPDAVFEIFSRKKWTKEFFFEEREKNWHEMSPEQAAARAIFLSYSGFNGVYRLNKNGKYNTAYGYPDKPFLLDFENLRECSKALQRADLFGLDFSKILPRAKKGDFVYCDPPYVPVAQGSFVQYDGKNFDISDHKRLLQDLNDAKKRGAKWLASNSGALAARELYTGHTIETVTAARNIAGSVASRAPINEILVSSE